MRDAHCKIKVTTNHPKEKMKEKGRAKGCAYTLPYGNCSL